MTARIKAIDLTGYKGTGPAPRVDIITEVLESFVSSDSEVDESRIHPD